LTAVLIPVKPAESLLGVASTVALSLHRDAREHFTIADINGASVVQGQAGFDQVSVRY
jgi:anthranilate phosphoribosyltransferase